MKSHNSVYSRAKTKTQAYLCTLFIAASFICCAYFIWLRKDSYTVSTPLNVEANDTQMRGTRMEICNDKCRPVGTESLPKGIVSTTTNLEMSPLSGPVNDTKEKARPISLLAMPVGIKQKRLANVIVKKFLEDGFAIILFHYDGLVDQWNDLGWSDNVIHISATNQTKWWFAKRFLHPDIVAEYEYIFLWDEDLGVDNFHPKRYISIIKEEGLEISQPALDPSKSKVHHRITVRNQRIRVHRRYYRAGRCDGNSTVPPCVGWVEMMAPVFSRAAWRCAWHMIQNDLIHAWGLDMQLGYCAQGDRSIKVGVVDEEYIAHLGLPTLGGQSDKNTEANLTTLDFSDRVAIRLRSYAEMRMFTTRWNNAVKEDGCWIDPYLHN